VIGVVLVRRGDNPELRYAMRSWAANVPGITGLIALGMPPDWVKAQKVLTPQSLTKYANTTNGLLYACHRRLLPKEFVLLNDDFFALRKDALLPVWHRGPMLGVVDEYRRRGINSSYVRGMEATANALIRDGYDEPLCYEVHAPMVVDRDLLAQVLRRYSTDKSIRVLHKRSAYGNVAAIGGVQVEDVKIRTPQEAATSGVPLHPEWNGKLPDLEWVSTSDEVWAAGAGSLIMSRFPTPSPWESNPNVRQGLTSPGKVRRSPLR
jgi:hypothetical protein